MISEIIKYMHLKEDAKAVEKHLKAIANPATTDDERNELRFRTAMRLSRIAYEVELVKAELMKSTEQGEKDE